MERTGAEPRTVRCDIARPSQLPCESCARPLPSFPLHDPRKVPHMPVVMMFRVFVERLSHCKEGHAGAAFEQNDRGFLVAGKKRGIRRIKGSQNVCPQIAEQFLHVRRSAFISFLL